MQSSEYGVRLSASDLMRFAGCAHATTLDLAWMRGEGAAPAGDSEDAELLQRHGDAHEARHLARLRAAGRSVVEIVKQGSLAQGVAATRAALERGAEVVFQGALAGGMWGGWSDFLERVERPSALGTWSYEVADTKLKRKPHPKHVLQLALYSDLLAEVQGVAPEHAHVELGNGTRATIRLAGLNSVLRVLLPPALKRLGNSFPGLEFDIHEAAPAEALDLLYGRRVTVGLVAANSIASASVGFRQVPVASDPYVFAVPASIDLEGVADPDHELSEQQADILNSCIQFTFGTQF